MSFTGAQTFLSLLVQQIEPCKAVLELVNHSSFKGTKVELCMSRNQKNKQTKNTTKAGCQPKLTKLSVIFFGSFFLPHKTMSREREWVLLFSVPMWPRAGQMGTLKEGLDGSVVDGPWIGLR